LVTNDIPMTSLTQSTAALARLIQLTKRTDTRGNLSVIEEGKDIPFEIKHTHWIYDVPGGGNCRGCAFRATEVFIVALSGSFDVILDDGQERKTIRLERSYYGLYVPAEIWHEMVNFSTNSLAFVLSSAALDEDDCIRDYGLFKAERHEKEQRF